jgi:hypothetical protein
MRGKEEKKKEEKRVRLGDLGDPVITNWTSGLYEYLVGRKNRERIITTWGKHSGVRFAV